MPKIERLNPNKHHQTRNKRGFMHPLSDIAKRFTLFATSATKPVIDMGCAYGNTTLAALDMGAETVIACDMEQEHLDVLQDQVYSTELASCLVTKQGIFPDGFSFADDSIAGIHISHLLEYLSGEEVERGLANCFKWLCSGGKLFILTYSIYILELANDKFSREYKQRLETKVKWPGYLENFDAYSYIPNENQPAEAVIDSPFPTALHMFEITPLVEALQTLGFIIEFAEYLQGRTNGAAEETWHDGKEYVGIIASKP